MRHLRRAVHLLLRGHRVERSGPEGWLEARHRAPRRVPARVRSFHADRQGRVLPDAQPANLLPSRTWPLAPALTPVQRATHAPHDGVARTTPPAVGGAPWRALGLA